MTKKTRGLRSRKSKSCAAGGRLAGSRGKGRRRAGASKSRRRSPSSFAASDSSPAQVDAIKEAPDEPLVPGKLLPAGDAQRDRILDQMKQVAAKSKADIEPIESQHVTLWAAKEVQQKYLPDVQKLEKFFHTRCAEPIRSGLDKRSTHVILLKDHAEYEVWWRAMFDLFGDQFAEKDNPGGNAHFRAEILKGRIFYWFDFCTISAGELSSESVRRQMVAGVGYQYIGQLANRFDGPLQTGFIDWAETAVYGFPASPAPRSSTGWKPGT